MSIHFQLLQQLCQLPQAKCIPYWYCCQPQQQLSAWNYHTRKPLTRENFLRRPTINAIPMIQQNNQCSDKETLCVHLSLLLSKFIQVGIPCIMEAWFPKKSSLSVVLNLLGSNHLHHCSLKVLLLPSRFNLSLFWCWWPYKHQRTRWNWQCLWTHCNFLC